MKQNLNHKMGGMLKKWQCLLLLAFLMPLSMMAQTISVSGVVKDGSGLEIIGANVIEKGTTNGVITDFDGKFTLNVSSDATLLISYVGYQDQEIKVAGKKFFEIILKEDNEMLDEVVVVGYGTMKKSDMTGAVTSIDTKELAKRTTINPAEALQGKVSGVSIQKSSGAAGSGVSVKIRGVNSFGGNSPLYIIDGFPGDIANINPQDIASMEILKDGAAAAIYGSTAANGVIIVTTKNGKKGEMKIDFHSYLSARKVSKHLEMLDAAGYKKVHAMMYDNYNMYANADKQAKLPAYITKETGVDTDWQDEVLRTGIMQNYMFSVRGGNDQTLYSLSYNHSFEKGIFLGDDFGQDNARMKLHTTKGIVDIDANIAFVFQKNHNIKYSMKEMYMISPLVPVYDENNEYGYGLTDFDGLPNNRNIMADQHYKWSKWRSYETNANASLTFHLTDWLTYKSSYSYRGVNTRNKSHSPKYVSDVKSPVNFPSSGAGSNYWQQQMFDNVLTFSDKFGKHSITAMIGSSIQAEKEDYESVGVEGKKLVNEIIEGKIVGREVDAGFVDENFRTVNAGEGGIYNGSGGWWKYNRASFFGRLNYNYADKYLFQFTMRRDGSSKFGRDSRWGNFPSVALGWRIDQENFFPKNIAINSLKLRASWGQLGNESALGLYHTPMISTGNWMGMGFVKGGNPWGGSIAWALENRKIKWETTDTKNIGIDFGLWNNKLTGAINYYDNRTKDLLITKALAPSVGVSSPTLNVGEISNKGFELELSYNDHAGDFNYNVGFNVSTNRNRVDKLADEGQVLWGAGLHYGEDHFVNQTKVGKPIGAYYLYQADGIFQSMEEVNAHVSADGNLLQPLAKPGDIRFVDENGDGVIDDSDKIYKGSGRPKVEANFNLGGEWKGLDFSAQIGGAFGHKLYNGNKFFYEGMASGSNFLTSTLDAWTPNNTNTDIPRAVLSDPNKNARESTRFLENGNFVRLRNVQIGYTLPASLTKKLSMDNVRFYVSGDNLLTITGYDGIDPEFATGILTCGVDRHIYPFSRTYTVGAQITF